MLKSLCASRNSYDRILSSAAKAQLVSEPVYQSEQKLFWIPANSPPDFFPDTGSALRRPDGLLAAGGDLSPQRLLSAYARGIFPWNSENEPILWWSPDPRTVLYPEQLHISRSLRRSLRRSGFQASFDTAFVKVMEACAGPRHNQPQQGTWITPMMQKAYTELHRLGYAHSLEIVMDGKLAGGLYGVVLGSIFFGESMFSHVDSASKIALACLARQLNAWGFKCIDCQVRSEHLMRLGCISIPRTEFLDLIHRNSTLPGHSCLRPWQFDIPLDF